MKLTALIMLIFLGTSVGGLCQESIGSDVPVLSTPLQLAPPETADAQEKPEILAAPQTDVEQLFRTKLDALELNKKSFEETLTFLKWIVIGVSFLISALGLGMSFLGLKTLRDVKTIAGESARTAIDDAIKSGNKQRNELSELIKSTITTASHLEFLRGKIGEFTALADYTEVTSTFDPFVEYFELRSEVQERKKKTRDYLNNAEGISLDQTTHDPKFRRKAALVFEKLLDAARGDDGNEKRKFSTVDLFNAAAIAAEIDMGFAALELMEIAGRTTEEIAPEIEARLIRQKLTYGRVSDEEAKTQISRVLQRVKGFDVHHVVSEAFNIALRTADPEGVVKIINQNLDRNLKSVSYVKLNSARLLAMGSSKAAWDLVDAYVNDGLTAMASESSEARWYESAQDEFARLVLELPEKFPMWKYNALEAFGTHADVQAFAKRNGLSLTQALIRQDLIDAFIGPQAD